MLEHDDSESHDEMELQLSNGGIRARYTTETFTYYQGEGSSWSISISCATTAIGGRLVSDNHDSTGVMLWPASHLMCQHIVQGDIVDSCSHNQSLHKEAVNVLELGCGCGLVSLVGVLHASHVKRWMATDIDTDALELCRRNFASYGMDGKSGRGRIRSLKWGDRQQIESIMTELDHNRGDDVSEPAQFDLVVGADIVYPDTGSETLSALFSSVDTALKGNGSFYLAFATRDGAKTPSRLLCAASDAGFAVERLPALPSDMTRTLPPLLDSKLLVLRRRSSAREHNLKNLGTAGCAIFPGLWDAIERLENPSSDEEWEPPFANTDYDDANLESL